MSLLVISQLPPPVHGSTVMTRLLVTTLTRSGHPVRVVERDFSGSVEQVGRFSVRKLLRVPGLVLRVWRGAVARRAPVSVFFATNRPGSFLVDVLLSIVLRASRGRVVLYLHTVGFQRLADRGPAWRFLVARLLASGDLVVVLGPRLRPDVERWVGAGRLVEIPNAVPDVPTGPAAPRRGSGGGPRLLFLSNLLPEKGAHTAVAVAERLREAHAGLVLTVAGASSSPEYDATLRGLAADPALRGTVEMVGAADPQLRDRLLAGSDLLLFPSTYPYEAQPLILLEAMRAGLPSVAFDVGGVGDVVVDGVSGRLVPPGDLDALAAAADELLRDVAQRSALGRGAQELAAARFSEESYARAWAAVLERLGAG